MKRLMLSVIMLMTAIAAMAQQPEAALKFHADSTFKIIQLTDLHFNPTMPEESAKTFARMDYIVGEEHPDFIAITGDVIYGGHPSKELLKSIVARLDSYKVPYSIVYGNHDAEQEMSRAEMSQIIADGTYSLNTLNEAGELADIRLTITSDEEGNVDPFDIYMLDSHDYSQMPDKVGGYAWFTKEQIDWMRSSCENATQANGGCHVPSLAFFHIPFPEFYDAWVLAQEKRHNGVVGLRGEYGGHPRINSGMYATMLETGNVIGVFCGHDHDSDYIVPYYGMALVYGRYSGDDSVYNHLAHGTRVILIKQGESAFRTWIHEDDGRIQYNVKFSDGEIAH